MAYDEELADRLRLLLEGVGVTEKKMFGGVSLLLGGNMAIAAISTGGILVRVAAADTEALLREPGAEPFDMGKRGPMKGWLAVRPDALDDDSVLRAWADRGLAYAASLPPK